MSCIFQWATQRRAQRESNAQPNVQWAPNWISYGLLFFLSSIAQKICPYYIFTCVAFFLSCILVNYVFVVFRVTSIYQQYFEPIEGVSAKLRCDIDVTENRRIKKCDTPIQNERDFAGFWALNKKVRFCKFSFNFWIDLGVSAHLHFIKKVVVCISQHRIHWTSVLAACDSYKRAWNQLKDQIDTYLGPIFTQLWLSLICSGNSFNACLLIHFCLLTFKNKVCSIVLSSFWKFSQNAKSTQLGAQPFLGT